MAVSVKECDPHSASDLATAKLFSVGKMNAALFQNNSSSSKLSDTHFYSA
jgi:hypothetical protein